MNAGRGNRVLIGFECAWPLIHPDGSYAQHERWPDAQIITMRDATAAVLQQLGYGPERVIGRKEYATHYLNIKWAQAISIWTGSAARWARPCPDNFRH
ncbi:peptidoglycan binding domain-containing protein [Mycobacteroides abscessus subsp. bolletii]|nr:peptidoglycan binding domain-containing protein [Mycobacteroides abscessus]SKX68744.1 peptidoglycan binding domain-containing protein [Mycobacteroides abscessus subsp. bolletii]CPS45835.1 peptidoglycan binding domain-containing protein [Mycobacteroides abscessus]CPS54864.1 peptidoglycan binding domain-containing protein [Mycobacteroides abscessus]CPT37822.1 peptidoglycan binding domain-containing protein [Mycobacteroides abscessus]